MNRNDTNIEHNAVTAVGDGSDDIIDVEQDTIEDKVVGQKKNQNVQKNATLAEVDLSISLAPPCTNHEINTHLNLFFRLLTHTAYPSHAIFAVRF